jgi:Membrane proteins related to metalloendopeptidases
VKQAYHTGVFGRRRELPTVIIARGEHIRYFKVRPWMIALAGSAAAAFLLVTLAAATYLTLHEDIVSAALVRQARLERAYEERIAALRAQLDRVTSRQLLEQQLMQRKMAELVERQEQLTRQQSRLSPVLERAGELRADEQTIPVPSPRPEIRAGLTSEKFGLPTVASAYSQPEEKAQVPWPLRPGYGESGTAGETEEQVLSAIDRSLDDLEADQLARIGSLTETAYQTTEAISAALDAAGIPIAEDYGVEPAGGPLLAAVGALLPFEEKVRELDEALDRLEKIKQTARRIPIANPLPGAAVTSSFGIRSDPIIGRPAHHSGVDFRAEYGAPVRATGSGTVIKAGWNGGYGRMVEIDHGNGITTRYAHLSKIMVQVGAHVEKGGIVGRVGSSGRSTGPHLHYEVRRNGRAVNPLTFISAGRRIQKYL